MGAIVRQRKNKDGSISLRIDIIYKGKRVIETLPYKLCKAISPADRETNKTLLTQAKKAAAAKAAELDRQGFIAPIIQRKVPVVKWMNEYGNNYLLKDKRNIVGATRKFETFLKEEGKAGLTFGQLSEDIIQGFWEYLMHTCTGEGDASYFRRFKKIIKAAYKANLLSANIAVDVKAVGGGKAKKKDVLTLNEIEVLKATEIENQQIRNAFLFCCSTGLRWCDVVNLKWENVDLSSENINFSQTKTGLPITIPLISDTVQYLGVAGDPETYVFKLPSANGANKTLKAWIKRAGIMKAITWHNARHSFGTNLIHNKADIVTTSKLLGHSSLKHTQRYVDSADNLKRDAVQTLQRRLSTVMG
jgi:integrase/recombinase XerD